MSSRTCLPIFSSHRVGHDCSSECSHEVGQTSIVFSYLKSKFLRSRPLVLAFKNVSSPARKVSNLSPANKTPEISVAKDFSSCFVRSFNYQSTQGRFIPIPILFMNLAPLFLSCFSLLPFIYLKQQPIRFL